MTRKLCLTVIVAAACGAGGGGTAPVIAPPRAPAASSQPPPQQIQGRVILSAGEPAIGADVVVSGPNFEPLVVSRTDSSGHFSTSLPVSPVAATAMLPDQSGYVEHFVPGSDIQMSTDCEAISGRLDTGGTPINGDNVKFARRSGHPGELFAASVGSDGSFHGCLPKNANYALGFPEAYSIRVAVASLPLTQPMNIHVQALTASEEVPTTFELAPQTRVAFAADLPASVSVLGFGESNHGTREFYDERLALALQLAPRGFRFIMLEAGYGGMIALDDYINGARVNIRKAVADLGYWVYDTQTLLGVVDQLRRYNLSVAPTRRIHLIGFDTQKTSGEIDYLLHNSHVPISVDVSALLARLVDHDGKAWPTLTTNERDATREALTKIVNGKTDGNGLGSRANRAVLAAQALLSRFELLDITDSTRESAARDASMAKLALAAIALEPHARVMLWGHVAHLGREYIIGQPTMGALLTAALGTNYRVYGLLAAHGSVRAWDADGKIGVTPHELPAPSAFSADAVLEAHAGDSNVTYWTFANATGEAARWLAGIHPIHELGAVFPHGTPEWNWDLRMLDGAILFKQVTPTDPTPTGERHADP